MPPTELAYTIQALIYFGDVVFAVSGALVAARYRMDVFGYVLVGTITGIGGGTLRDLLLGRVVWWTQAPFELLLCAGAALATYFLMPGVTDDEARRRGIVWADALGLAAFGVVGCHVALQHGSPFIIAVFMGMVTATGGGVIRDVIANRQPMIVRGELYATAALAGSLAYALLLETGLNPAAAQLLAFGLAFALRAAAIVFGIRMGPPGQFIRIGRRRP